MAHTYDELKGKTVAELRDIAKGIQHEAVQGHSQMNKERLLPALCRALGIEMHEHHEAHGIDKTSIKAQLRTLKAMRESALESHDHEALKSLRRKIHHLNHQIRSHVS